ncbi:MAG: OmpA family protein [Planctomycetes bacterium]|nr:OmpA family protein [Planctomycetota bacterium]
MRRGKWIVGMVLGCWVAALGTGCASLDDHRRLQALNRNLEAEKMTLSQELFDARSSVDALRLRSESCERELDAKGQIVANLQSENELLDEMRQTAQAALEEMSGKFADITIAAPMLPEKLDSALRRFAEVHPEAVAYDPIRGTVKWKADLLFALGSDVVRESSLGTLKHFTEILNSPEAADFEIIVVGHTDNRPISRSATKAKHPTNWHLSAHRAIAVSDVLQKNKYTPQRIGVMGCGEYRPVADNSTAQGSSQNRRVEIYIVPKGSILRASIASPGSDRAVASMDATP